MSLQQRTQPLPRVLLTAFPAPPITDRCWHLAPLQHRILGDAAVRVDVDALVFVANQNLGPGFVGQNDDGMRMDGTLDLLNTHAKAKFLKIIFLKRKHFEATYRKRWQKKSMAFFDRLFLQIILAIMHRVLQNEEKGFIFVCLF